MSGTVLGVGELQKWENLLIFIVCFLSNEQISQQLQFNVCAINYIITINNNST